jgi:CRP/FNR family cyclic AMP-dependent transcriptional regulator
VLGFARQDTSGGTMPDARIELLQRMPVFGGIKPAIIELLLGSCPIVSVLAGNSFFEEGEPGDCMFVLETGKAAVVRRWAGQSCALRVLAEGDCFGEMAVIDLGPRSASVRALEDCVAIQISANNLYRIYSQDLKQFALIQMNMSREVCRRLRDADDLLFGAKMKTFYDEGDHRFAS